MEVGEGWQPCLEGHAVDVDDVVPAEVQPHEAAQVPEDSLGYRGQRVAGQDQRLQRGRQGLDVVPIQLRYLVV